MCACEKRWSAYDKIVNIILLAQLLPTNTARAVRGNTMYNKLISLCGVLDNMFDKAWIMFFNKFLINVVYTYLLYGMDSSTKKGKSFRAIHNFWMGVCICLSLHQLNNVCVCANLNKLLCYLIPAFWQLFLAFPFMPSIYLSLFSAFIQRCVWCLAVFLQHTITVWHCKNEEWYIMAICSQSCRFFFILDVRGR